MIEDVHTRVESNWLEVVLGNVADETQEKI